MGPPLSACACDEAPLPLPRRSRAARCEEEEAGREAGNCESAAAAWRGGRRKHV